MAHVIPQRGGSLLYKAARSAQITIHQLSRPIPAMRWPSSIQQTVYSSRPSAELSRPGLYVSVIRDGWFSERRVPRRIPVTRRRRCFDFSFGLRDCNTIELLDGWL